MADPHPLSTSARLERLLKEVQQGNAQAQEKLIELAWEKLLRLTRRMFHTFSGLRRFEDTDDVFQRSIHKFCEALQRIKPASVREFFGLAALQIRRTLVDLRRHYYGPLGAGTHEQAVPEGGPHLAQEPAAPQQSPADLLLWEEFHQKIGELPDELREVFELTWYYELTREEVAELLGVSVRTVHNRWREGRLSVYKALGGHLPGR